MTLVILSATNRINHNLLTTIVTLLMCQQGVKNGKHMHLLLVVAAAGHCDQPQWHATSTHTHKMKRNERTVSHPQRKENRGERRTKEREQR
jgi:hypothetical protein